MRACVYDCGALIAIDKLQVDALRRHQDRMRQGYQILVPAPAAAQAVRAPARQVRLMRTLRGCEVVPFRSSDVPQVGTLLAKAGTADVVDAFVALTAAQAAAPVISPDIGDLEHLLATLGTRLPVFPP